MMWCRFLQAYLEKITDGLKKHSISTKQLVHKLEYSNLCLKNKDNAHFYLINQRRRQEPLVIALAFSHIVFTSPKAPIHQLF